MADSLVVMHVEPDAKRDYEEFVREHGELLRRALVARFGVDIGCEATDEALLNAWKNWTRVSRMKNPTGYLYRVGQSAARPLTRWRRRTARLDFPQEDHGEADADRVDLFDALHRLKEPQRIAVVLVKAHGHTYFETAQVLGITEVAVGNHVRRGLRALRRELGEDE